jgi:hypothetical protein
MMRLRTVMCLIAVALTAATSLAALQHGPSRQKSDAISGDWDALFKIAGSSANVVLSLKLDGDKVAGNVASQHTGPGTLKGSYADDKLSFTMDFAAHESIAVTGALKDGKLSGEFATEGMKGTWEAKKK